MPLLANYIDRRFMEPGRRMKASQFDELAVDARAVVFLGDSITEGGAWHEWFPELVVANRGIGGDTAEGVLARLDAAIGGRPSQLVLLIGTNDLARRRSVAQIAADVDRIVGQTRAASPATQVILQSVMPRSRKYRDVIRHLNAEYVSIAADYAVEYLDLWPTLADAHGGLRNEYTADELHLNGSGYRAWATVLRERLA